MKCKCGERMIVTHSYDAPGVGGSQNCLCTECGRQVTVVSFVAFEEPEHGQGAAAVAKKLKKGRLTPKIEETPDE